MEGRSLSGRRPETRSSVRRENSRGSVRARQRTRIRGRSSPYPVQNHEIFAFDVAHDGKRFIVAEDPNPGAQTRLNMTINWFSEVKRKLREAKAP